MKPSRDCFERLAQRLWKRWHRAAQYAMETTAVDAMLRYRLRDQEVRRAIRDLQRGCEGLAYMLDRARRCARVRLTKKVEDLAIRLAYSMPMTGRHGLARAAARAGFPTSPTTIRRLLGRRGLWRRAEG